MIDIGFTKHEVHNIAIHGSIDNLSAGERAKDIFGILLIATPLGPAQEFVGKYISFVKCSYERNFDAYNKDLQTYISKTHLPKNISVLYTIDIMQRFMLPGAKLSLVPVTHAYFERAIIFIQSLSVMEVWFVNSVHGMPQKVGFAQSIAVYNTLPPYRYQTVPKDVLLVRDALLSYKMVHFRTFSATDYGILSVASPNVFAFTVRLMTCLVTVNVGRHNVMFIEVSFGDESGSLTIIQMTVYLEKMSFMIRKSLRCLTRFICKVKY